MSPRGNTDESETREMTLYLECEAEEFLEEREELAERVLRGALASFSCPYETEVSLYIVGEERIRELNRLQRGIDRVTDVLSFPNLELVGEGDFSGIAEGDADCFDCESGHLLLGEIVICAEKVYAQAKEYGHSPQREYAFLITHSLLHLLGYDHEEEAQRLRMEERQERILSELGITREPEADKEKAAE